jgi:plastocyanin
MGSGSDPSNRPDFDESLVVKRWLVFLLLAASMVMLSSCEPESADVDIEGFRFQPATLRVAARTTVTWTNRDDTRHTITSGHPGHMSGVFHQLFVQGGTFSHVFDEAGTFAYFCNIHRSMRGEIRVT